jgi:hypothetical protein
VDLVETEAAVDDAATSEPAALADATRGGKIASPSLKEAERVIEGCFDPERQNNSELALSAVYSDAEWGLLKDAETERDIDGFRGAGTVLEPSATIEYLYCRVNMRQHDRGRLDTQIEKIVLRSCNHVTAKQSLEQLPQRQFHKK